MTQKLKEVKIRQRLCNSVVCSSQNLPHILCLSMENIGRENYFKDHNSNFIPRTFFASFPRLREGGIVCHPIPVGKHVQAGVM